MIFAPLGVIPIRRALSETLNIQVISLVGFVWDRSDSIRAVFYRSRLWIVVVRKVKDFNVRIESLIRFGGDALLFLV